MNHAILLLQYYPFSYHKKLEQLLFLNTSLINIINLFAIRNLIYFYSSSMIMTFNDDN